MSEEHPSVSAVGSHLDEEVSRLARQYYEDEGQPEGRAEEHWFRAEEEIRNRRNAGGDSQQQNAPQQ